LNYLAGIPVGVTSQIVLIVCITAVASISVLTGLDRGVRRLSELNLILAVVLMLFVLFAGPTAFLLNAFVQNIGLYLSNFVAKTFNIYAYEPKPWIESWTLFYWAWWISWSPFVGMFIARISRGRTVREFSIAVLLVPASFTFLWMTVFGNTAIFVDTTVAGGALATAVADDISVALFRFFEYLPLSMIASAIAVLLVTVFFITSSDSGSLVIDTIAAGGETETPAVQRLFWCILEGVVASLLLLAGGLAALQTATIASALPFTIVMLALCFGLFRGLSADVARHQVAARVTAARPTFDPSWQKRLSRILHQPTRREVERFLESTVDPGLRAVAGELKAKGIPATVEHEAARGSVSLTVPAEGTRNFVYGVELDSRLLPAFALRGAARADAGRERTYEAKTYFGDGSHGYDIMGLDKDQIIADVLGQYEQYRGLFHSARSELYVTAPDQAEAGTEPG
jgi:choline/glycine/proline betaine transport protein